jgi:hypothetical protein
MSASDKEPPIDAWAILAAKEIIREIESWDGRKNKRWTMKNTTEYTSDAKKDT